MTGPLRFVHTADWQLGLRARYIPGDAGAEVRNARIRTVRRIGEVAREQGAEFVVVAGDVFEHHGLRPQTVRQTFDALAEVGQPVYLLPGNHDPDTPDSLYRSDLWRRECPPNVHVLATTDPVRVRDDAYLLPCPLTDRRAFGDPTTHLSAAYGPAQGFRIGVAHGGIREILERLGDDEYEPGAAVPLDTAARGVLDYLALGDWHGCRRIDDRTWYSGTPEATRFKEQDPGHVLVVEVPAPRALPQVEAVSVQTLTWRRIENVELADSADVDALAARLDALPAKADCLIELRLAGTLDIAQRARLDSGVLDPARDRFRWVRVRDERLHTIVREEDLQEIACEGWVRDVVDALLAAGTDDAARAVRLLHRLHREVAP